MKFELAIESGSYQWNGGVLRCPGESAEPMRTLRKA